MSARILVWLIVGVLLALGASACESTQEESAKAAKAAAAQQTRNSHRREHANHRSGGS